MQGMVGVNLQEVVVETPQEVVMENLQLVVGEDFQVVGKNSEVNLLLGEDVERNLQMVEGQNLLVVLLQLKRLQQG